LSSDLLPVSFEFALAEEVVEIFVLLGLFEWEDSLNDDEEDDSS